jgi:predicted aspartyl protease
MKAEVPIELIDIQGDGNHLLIKAFINAQQVNLLIDTGASRTVFDKTKLSSIITSEFEKMDRLSTGLGTNSMNSEKITISELRFGDDVRFENYEAVVLDISHVNESYVKLGYEGITGVMGGDLLLKLNAVIDYGTRKLFLEY